MIILSFLIILVSLSIHEFAHAITALAFGDDTAKKQGRLTLNPLKHIDPFGTVLLPLLLFFTAKATGGFIPVFGYAKPVPVHFQRLSPRKLGIVLVALAGPFSNFLIAFIANCVLILLHPHGFWEQTLQTCIFLNLLLAIFNLIPIPPLDGGRIVSGFLPEPLSTKFNSMEMIGFIAIIIFLQMDLFNPIYKQGFKLFFGLFDVLQRLF
jgi:Zn-dependent protease